MIERMSRSTYSTERKPVAERGYPFGERSQSGGQFRLLVEAVAEYAIFMLDPAGYVTTWNVGAKRIKGYVEEEILGRHFSVFYTADEVRAGVPEEALQVAARDGQWISEGWRVRKDNSLFWAHVTITALRSDEGELYGFAKVTRDMTEQKKREDRREEALRRSERRYRGLFETSQEGIVLTTPAGELIEINPAGQEILGYSKRELQAMNARDLYVDPQERCRLIERTIREGAVRGLNVRLHRKDGKEIVCAMSSTAQREADGDVVAFQTFFRDITEQERARTALRESEAKFRALAEDAPVGILLIQDGRLGYANKALARMYGYTPEEITNQIYIDELVHPADRERVRKSIEMRLSGERDSMKFRFRGLTKEKEVIYVEAYGTRIDYQGRPAIIGIDIDITDRLQLQRDVLRMQEEERRRLGQDLHDGVASHLTGVAIMLGALARHATLDDNLTSRIREIQKLVNESCEDVRRLSRGLTPAGLSGEGLSAALERLAANIENGRFEERGDMPELEDDAAAHLYWIAQEATTNARKYAEAETIVICLWREDDTFMLEVEDDGRGFDVSSVEHGGLGLRTMQYRAELLGAEFTVDTEVGEGTRVRLRLSA